jgi:hypothetical protein
MMGPEKPSAGASIERVPSAGSGIVRSFFLGRFPGWLPFLLRATLEFPLRAPWAVERDFRRLVVGEVRLPALDVSRHPGPFTLGALGDQGDALGVHEPSLLRA